MSFAQPLLDETDGSLEQMQKALSLSQFCWNIALLPEGRREESITEMQDAFEMDDAEFESFRLTVIQPMIRRHEEMFPDLRPGLTVGRNPIGTPTIMERLRSPSVTTAREKKNSGVDRYGPCPCNSGKKYKFCCGK
jgi:uncharacterized protein YecA (UPF0149 family)